MVGRYGLERVARAYPRWSRADLAVLLRELEALAPFEYEPFTEHRTVPFAGRFVNVLPSGVRPVKDAGPWPPDDAAPNVFVFGGSTAMGLGVADGETLPSYLQEALRRAVPGAPVRVYNLGRSGYHGVPERILFEQLLVSGIVPDAAVFLDGLNDCTMGAHAVPPYLWSGHRSETLRALVEAHERGGVSARLAALAAALPLTELALRVGGRLGLMRRENAYDLGPSDEAVRRWLANRELVDAAASRFGVGAIFVWQPIPTYRYDLSAHLFADQLRGAPGGACYERMRAVWHDGSAGERFLWLADAQEKRRENLYVDSVHYTATFNAELAEAIAKALVSEGLVRKRKART